jgi:DNA-nicking Smr family endonuclease
MAERRLSPDEAALWARVMATVTPLSGGAEPIAVEPPSQPKRQSAVMPKSSVAVKLVPTASTARPTSNTLDGGWDRGLARGSVEPDATVDLHGHTLSSAYTILDQALERSRTRGDRVILLITGKPPRRDSERPHARGAIRAAVGDWLHASRHADAIAAVRGASPRHGGAGALYIVLRRPRSAPKS